MNRFLAIGLLGLSLSAGAQTETTGTFPEKRAVETRSEYRPHIGVFIGGNRPEGNWRESTEVGLDLGYQPYIPFGLGLEISHADSESDVGDRLDRTDLLAKGTYNFGGERFLIKESYVGLGLGVAIRDDKTAAVAAPIIGFDIPLNTETSTSRVSLGANAKYAVVANEEPDALSVNAVMKYWY